MKKPKPKRKHGLSQMQRLLEQSIRHSLQIAAVRRRIAKLEKP